MWRELHPRVARDAHPAPTARPPAWLPSKTFAHAIWQIAVADVSMSLDNVLAVAGAARDHTGMLIFGLVLSIALMGAAATVIARFLEQYRWLSYLGLGIIAIVALSMIWEGSHEVWHAMAALER